MKTNKNLKGYKNYPLKFDEKLFYNDDSQFNLFVTFKTLYELVYLNKSSNVIFYNSEYCFSAKNLDKSID
jgi:hypothetical protein